MKHLFIIVLLVSSFSTFAQKIEFSQEFEALCDTIGVEIFVPVESDFQSIKTIHNPYQNYQAAIRSRKEKLEIRYAFQPYIETNPFTTMPHLQVTHSVTSAATNDEDAIIAFHEIEQHDLANFDADWGQMVIFRPKPGFSEQPFCKMVTLFKEGKGTTSVFYLFDDADNSAVDDFYFSLKF
ncbi:MAG: hypothetical protein ACI85O_000782 [Saprospiraceae bacterium]|jgi:hypothetical protein